MFGIFNNDNKRGTQNLFAQLEVEGLEERIMPTTWPINQNPLQVYGTHGQYQDAVVNVVQPVRGMPAVATYNNNIHLHEGLDISAAAGTAVRSVLAGRVEAVFTSTAKPFDSVVATRDTAHNRQ